MHGIISGFILAKEAVKTGIKKKAAALIISMLLILAALLSPLGAAIAADDYNANRPQDLTTEQINASSALLIESKSKTVLLQKNADKAIAPASTTKMVTVILALEHGSLTDSVVVSENALNIPEDAANIKLLAGEELPLEDLLYALMLRSANDAAIAVAEYVSGSVGSFVELMNSFVYRLGCTGTHFTNPSGLDEDGHYTTAQDLATIAAYCMENESFARMARTANYTVPKTNLSKARSLNTSNELLVESTKTESNHYYAYANGIKTGTTDNAGYCLVSSATRDGVDLIAVVMNTTVNGRWSDSKRLFEYGFTQYISATPKELFDRNPFTVDISGFSENDTQLGKLQLSLKLLSSKECYITGTQDEIDALAYSFKSEVVVQYQRDFAAPVASGEQMGTLTYYPAGGDAVEYALVATRAVDARTDVPPTLAQIESYTYSDKNPLPRFSLEYVLIPLAALILIILLLRRLLKRRKKNKVERKRVPKPKFRSYR